MKKFLTTAVIILAAFVTAISFCSCKGKTNSDQTTTAQSESAAANADQSIVGSWSLGTYNAAGKVMNLTYSIKDGIYYETFEGSTAPVKRPYRVENNQFIVEDSYGEEIVYNKR